jgi:Zn-dependent protease
MSALRASRLALRPPVPVTIGRGGFAPGLVLGALFALIAARGHLPVATAAALGGVGGTISLLVHEFGHVGAARRLVGIRANAVSLIWLGAATRFEGDYASGRDQAKVALGGPTMSVVFALSLTAGFVYLPLPLGIKDLLLLLILLNLAIAALNLIPAHPLDGHKLVVGLLWSATGCAKKARRIVRRVGLAWLAAEFATAAFLLVERPRLGLTVIALAASFFAQKQLVRRRPKQR